MDNEEGEAAANKQGSGARYRLTIDRDSHSVRVTDVAGMFKDDKGDDLLDSGKKERELVLQDMQFTIVNGINYAENTVSFKCANELDGEVYYLYDNEELN